MKVAIVAVLLLACSIASTGQSGQPIKATPLSVCEIQNRPRDWDNQIVLIKAHYGYGMEDSFLWDENCRGADIDFDLPHSAESEDKSLHDLAYKRRIHIELIEDQNFRKFEKLTSGRNGMCPERDVVIEAVGRLDSIRHLEAKNPNCHLDFGMCNYSARFVLQSVKEVRPTDAKPACK